MANSIEITKELSEETMAVLVEEVADLVSEKGVEGNTFVKVTLEIRSN